MDTCEKAPTEQHFVLLYETLKRVAKKRLRNGIFRSHLQATLIIHEAYIKLLGGRQRHNQTVSRSQFLTLFDKVVRQIVIDHSRRQRSVKRGGNYKQVAMQESNISTTGEPSYYALDEALSYLETNHPECATIVRYRYLSDMSFADIAKAMKQTESWVMREWAFARAWLVTSLKE